MPCNRQHSVKERGEGPQFAKMGAEEIRCGTGWHHPQKNTHLTDRPLRPPASAHHYHHTDPTPTPTPAQGGPRRFHRDPQAQEAMGVAFPSQSPPAVSPSKPHPLWRRRYPPVSAPTPTLSPSPVAVGAQIRRNSLTSSPNRDPGRAPPPVAAAAGPAGECECERGCGCARLPAGSARVVCLWRGPCVCLRASVCAQTPPPPPPAAAPLPQPGRPPKGGRAPRASEPRLAVCPSALAAPAPAPFAGLSAVIPLRPLFQLDPSTDTRTLAGTHPRGGGRAWLRCCSCSAGRGGCGPADRGAPSTRWVRPRPRLGPQPRSPRGVRVLPLMSLWRAHSTAGGKLAEGLGARGAQRPPAPAGGRPRPRDSTSTRGPPPPFLTLSPTSKRPGSSRGRPEKCD